MTRRLTLRSERLTELTDDELRAAAGATGTGGYSGCLWCVLSVDRCPTQLACTVPCAI